VYESDHTSPSSAEVKNVWSCTSTPQYFFMALYLVKHRDNFTFTFMHQNMKLTPHILLACLVLRDENIKGVRYIISKTAHNFLPLMSNIFLSAVYFQTLITADKLNGLTLTIELRKTWKPNA
jgi:hypothetical protein